MTVRILIGDVREKLAELGDESVHCVVTSPPYWGLRDYGVAGQIGLEESPEEYIAEMVALFRQIRRVLRIDGTVWMNMGDSYVSGQGGRQASVGELPPEHRKARAQPRKRDDVDVMGWSERAVAPRWFPSRETGWKPKDLVGMPWMLAFALRADGWWLRRDIVWSKPNPMPESATDRPTTAHEYLFLLTKAPRYFYDAEAVREACQSGASDLRKMEEGKPRIGGKHKTLDDPRSKASAATNIGRKRSVGDPSGRNLRSVWEIATAPFPGAHFATFPVALVEPCIKAGTSERGVCPSCGAPWKRETDVKYENPGNRTTNGPRSLERHHETAGFAQRLERRVATLGWSPSCSCGGGAVPATVLDPFGGAGTTGLVADRLKRDAILIELNPAYADLARARIAEDAGMFAKVDAA